MNFDWQGKRVLVTGATGIVGSWLVRELLARRAYVVALVHHADPQSELLRSGLVQQTAVINGALEDEHCIERAINKHEVDTVFHLGAQPIVGVAQRAPLQTFETNIRGTYLLLDACWRMRTLVQRVVIASSDKAYGEQPNLPYREEMPLQGRYPYEVSKSCADLLAQSYAVTYGLPVTIARCGNIYGGGDLNWSRIVPGTIRSLLRGERPLIRSNGQFVRDYIYVQDVVRAYLRLAEEAQRSDVQGQGFNFSNEAPLTVLEMVNAVCQALGRTDLPPIIQNQAVGEIPDQYLSAEKAHRVLGWQAAYSLEQGLSETVAWYRQFFAHQED
jgi:CDP-glucose 4,6-dehydratase